MFLVGMLPRPCALIHYLYRLGVGAVWTDQPCLLNGANFLIVSPSLSVSLDVMVETVPESQSKIFTPQEKREG